MEWIVLGGLVWLVWWLIKGRKEQATLKRWENAPLENAELAKEYDWRLSEVNRTLNDFLNIELTKIEPLPDYAEKIWDEDFSTEFTLHLSRDGAMLFANNPWCEFRDLNPPGTRSQINFDISKIEEEKRAILRLVVNKLLEIGAAKCL